MPVIHITYRASLSESELADFEKCYKGIPVEMPDTDDSESVGAAVSSAEENIEEVKQSTPKQKKQKPSKIVQVHSDAETESDLSDDLVAELQITRISPRLAAQNEQNPPNQATPKKKKRKLWTDVSPKYLPL